MWLLRVVFNSSRLDLFQAFQQQAQELVALETIVLQTLGEYRLCCTDCTLCLLSLVFLVSTINQCNTKRRLHAEQNHWSTTHACWHFFTYSDSVFFLPSCWANVKKPHYLTDVLLLYLHLCLTIFLLGCRFWNNSWSSAHRCCEMFPASARYYLFPHLLLWRNTVVCYQLCSKTSFSLLLQQARIWHRLPIIWLPTGCYPVPIIAL